MKKLLMALVALALFSPGVTADIIVFKSGSAREGIIEEETPTSVKMRVKNAVIGFSRENIDRIEYSSPEENSKLDQKWKAQEKELEEKRKEKREKRKLDEERQKDKGLQQVGGQWVTRSEKAERRQKAVEAEINAQDEAALEEEQEIERASIEAERANALDENRPPEDFKKIAVGKFRVDAVAVGESTLSSRVTNRGKLAADLITLQVSIYDASGTLISSQEQEISDLGPGKHQDLEISIDMDSSVLAKVEGTVTDVVWR